MPNIYDSEKRQRIREKLLDEGFERLKAVGLQKTSVEDIAKSAGIAKGTFYNFFKSKDMFVLELIQYQQAKLKQELQRLVAERGYLTKDGVRRYIEHLVYGDHHVYAYLSAEELTAISVRTGMAMPMNTHAIQQTTLTLLDLIPDKDPACDWRILANLMRIIALTWMSRKQLLEEALDETIYGLISLIMDTIFGKGE